MSVESKIYAIYDIKSGMYGPAMTFVNDGTALRTFQEMLCSGDSQSLLSLYPADYILFCLGIYDQQSGKIVSAPSPMNIISGAEAFTRACAEASDRRRRAKALSGEVEPEQVDFSVPSSLKDVPARSADINAEHLEAFNKNEIADEN